MLRLYRTESEIRTRQINTLKIFNDNVTEVQEGTEYNVAFKAGVQEFLLHVLLTQDFPNDKPILRITPAVVHDWITGDGEITSAPGLLNFTVHSDLGRVVQAIIREFERTPPPLVCDQAACVITSPIAPAAGIDSDTVAMGRGSPFNYATSARTLQNTFMSTQSLMFPELNNLSLEELQFLNDCSERQDEFLENLPQFKEISKNFDNFISQIEELSDSNLSKKDRLEHLTKQIETKIEEVTKLAFDNEQLNTSYQMLSEKYSPRNIKDQLCEAAEKLNVECERIAESFLSGEIDVDKFLSTYIPIRTLSQTRKTKEEKLSQQLHNLEKAGF